MSCNMGDLLVEQFKNVSWAEQLHVEFVCWPSNGACGWIGLFQFYCIKFLQKTICILYSWGTQRNWNAHSRFMKSIKLLFTLSVSSSSLTVHCFELLLWVVADNEKNNNLINCVPAGSKAQNNFGLRGKQQWSAKLSFIPHRECSLDGHKHF